jgi:hypothetical protein
MLKRDANHRGDASLPLAQAIFKEWIGICLT